MKRIQFLLILLTMTLCRLSALDTYSIEDDSLISLLEAQRTNSQAWASNEAFLQTGDLQLDISRAALYPQLDAAIDGNGANSFLTRITGETEVYQLRNNYNLALSPSLSISQLLPSAGILTGSVSDTVSGSGLEESDYPLEPAADLDFNNILNLSLGLSQPLYFGNAYEAARTQMGEAHEINRIRYLDNRNFLISTAINDYYSLIQTAYQKQLVEARLETNTEYEKRMLSEHSLGLWTQAQLNSAKAARLQSEADLLKAEQSYSLARNRIKTLYGIELLIDPASADVEIIPFDRDSLDTAVMLETRNPETLITEKQVSIAESDIIITKKDSAFRLNAGGSYSYSNSFDGDSSSDSLSISLSLSMPLLDGAASKKLIELKQNEAIKLKTDLNEQQKTAASQLQMHLDNIELRQKLAEIYILQEEAAVFEYDKGSRELELGHITQKELLDLQIELENTRLTVLLNKIELNLAVLQLYRQLGFDLNIFTGVQEGAE